MEHRKIGPNPWLIAFALISLFFCLITVLGPVLPKFFRLFNLRNESNFAALFSGIFLLIIALHAWDGWARERTSNIRLAISWLLISLVMIALSFDEIGSIHERVPKIGDLSQWWSLMPFGLILLVMITYSLTTFWKLPEYRSTAVLIFVGVALLASVALQEYLEHNVNWDANSLLRFFKRALRPVVEEGTELLGMLVLLKATVGNTNGVLSSDGYKRHPVFEGILAWRRPVALLGLVFAPVIAYVTSIIPPDIYGHGIPADWPAVCFFSLAAVAVARPYFVSAGKPRPTDLILFWIAVIAVASTILTYNDPDFASLLTALSVLSLLTWTLDGAHSGRRLVSISAAIIACLAAIWIHGDNQVIVYTAIQWVAIAYYWMNSARAASNEAIQSK